MNFEQNQIITLNNKNEYFVINKIIYNNYTYAILLNINIDNDYFIVKQKDNLRLVKEDNMIIRDLLKEYL